MNEQQRAVVQQALDAFEHLHSTGDTQVFDMCYAPELIPALRQLLEQPAQEPVAWVKQILDAFPLFDDDGLDEEEHHCEWALQQDRKRLHAMLTTPLAQPEPDMYWDDDDSERPASDSIPELLFERWNNGDLAVGYEVSMTCAKQMEPLTVRVTEINEDTYDIEYEVVKNGGA